MNITDFGCNKTVGQLYLLLAIVMFVNAECEKFAHVRGLCLLMVEIKLEFLFSSCNQLSPYIICHHFAWKDNLLAA